MSKAKKTNIPVSIKMRLLNLSRESRLDYMKLLVWYLQERLLYRISMILLWWHVFANISLLAGTREILTNEAEKYTRWGVKW